MKTTLGVGISVLSALAAQGKDFDRTELNAMLDRLAASPEPKIEPHKGLNIELDESCLCQTCGKGIVEDEVRFGKLCWVINGRKVKAEPSDINLLSTFLDGKVILTGSRGAKSPLKKQLPRLRELLGAAKK